MKIQRLIILGILKEGPKHGYEIKKIIKKELGVFTSLENKSIYYPLKIMEKGRLIKKDAVKGQGRLLRYVYSITSHGNKEFLKLAMEAFLSEKRPFIDIDIPLYFLPYLGKKEVLSRIPITERWVNFSPHNNCNFRPSNATKAKNRFFKGLGSRLIRVARNGNI